VVNNFWFEAKNINCFKNGFRVIKDLNLNLEIKESSRKMFLSGEWDATSTLLEYAKLIENKFKDLPYLKFNAHFL